MTRSKIIIFIFIPCMLACCDNLYAQRKMTREEYIEMYKEISMRKMREYKIPASITLAQGILESGCGGSLLAIEAKNHFGIKCHTQWQGERYYYDDDQKDDCFRVYKDPEESYNDHSLFLTTRDRYKPLFDLKIDDYKGWAHGLKKAGYATNPQYAQLLIKIIEEQNLYRYDKLAMDNRYVIVTTPEQKAEAEPSSFIPTTELPLHFFSERAYNGREIYTNNGIKFVHAKEGDTYYRIAEDFDIYSYQLFKYNEKPKNILPVTGEIVYLEKKKNKGVVDFYFVQPGESMLDISQKTGITTKALYKKNRMKEGDRPAPGTMLWLKKKKP